MGWSESRIANQSGRVVVVTGANSGIGFEAARALAERGAEVVLACRSVERGRAAVERLAALGLEPVRFMRLDLASLASVRSFAQVFTREYSRLDLLINNAGVMMPPYAKTADGYELQFGTNHLGHFLLTAQLWPLLDASEGARVVNVSSVVHLTGRLRLEDLDFERGYDAGAAYSQSKLANLLFSQELTRRAHAAGSQVRVVSAHPGASATNLAVHVSRFQRAVFGALTQSVRAGAQPTLFAATSPEVESGGYYGPRVLMWGAPHAAYQSRAARNPELAAALWAVSEQRTGASFLSVGLRGGVEASPRPVAAASV